jgi:hypothetical protein
MAIGTGGVKLEDRVLDLGLNVLDTESTHIYVCSQQPTTFAEATTTYARGFKNFGAGNAFGAPGAWASGRKTSSVAITDGTITTTGTVACWAAVDATNSRLHAAGDLTGGGAVTAAQSFSLGTFDVQMQRSAVAAGSFAFNNFVWADHTASGGGTFTYSQAVGSCTPTHYVVVGIVNGTNADMSAIDVQINTGSVFDLGMPIIVRRGLSSVWSVGLWGGLVTSGTGATATITVNGAGLNYLNWNSFVWDLYNLTNGSPPTPVTNAWLDQSTTSTSVTPIQNGDFMIGALGYGHLGGTDGPANWGSTTVTPTQHMTGNGANPSWIGWDLTATGSSFTLQQTNAANDMACVAATFR